MALLNKKITEIRKTKISTKQTKTKCDTSEKNSPHQSKERKRSGCSSVTKKVTPVKNGNASSAKRSKNCEIGSPSSTRNLYTKVSVPDIQSVTSKKTNKKKDHQLLVLKKRSQSLEKRGSQSLNKKLSKKFPKPSKSVSLKKSLKSKSLKSLKEMSSVKHKRTKRTEDGNKCLKASKKFTVKARHTAVLTKEGKNTVNAPKQSVTAPDCPDFERVDEDIQFNIHSKSSHQSEDSYSYNTDVSSTTVKTEESLLDIDGKSINKKVNTPYDAIDLDDIIEVLSTASTEYSWKPASPLNKRLDDFSGEIEAENINCIETNTQKNRPDNENEKNSKRKYDDAFNHSDSNLKKHKIKMKTKKTEFKKPTKCSLSPLKSIPGKSNLNEYIDKKQQSTIFQSDLKLSCDIKDIVDTVLHDKSFNSEFNNIELLFRESFHTEYSDIHRLFADIDQFTPLSVVDLNVFCDLNGNEIIRHLQLSSKLMKFHTLERHDDGQENDTIICKKVDLESDREILLRTYTKPPTKEVPSTSDSCNGSDMSDSCNTNDIPSTKEVPSVIDLESDREILLRTYTKPPTKEVPSTSDSCNGNDMSNSCNRKDDSQQINDKNNLMSDSAEVGHFSNVMVQNNSVQNELCPIPSVTVDCILTMNVSEHNDSCKLQPDSHCKSSDYHSQRDKIKTKSLSCSSENDNRDVEGLSDLHAHSSVTDKHESVVERIDSKCPDEKTVPEISEKTEGSTDCNKLVNPRISTSEVADRNLDVNNVRRSTRVTNRKLIDRVGNKSNVSCCHEDIVNKESDSVLSQQKNSETEQSYHSVIMNSEKGDTAFEKELAICGFKSVTANEMDREILNPMEEGQPGTLKDGLYSSDFSCNEKQFPHKNSSEATVSKPSLTESHLAQNVAVSSPNYEKTNDISERAETHTPIDTEITDNQVTVNGLCHPYSGGQLDKVSQNKRKSRRGWRKKKAKEVSTPEVEVSTKEAEKQTLDEKSKICDLIKYVKSDQYDADKKTISGSSCQEEIRREISQLVCHTTCDGSFDETYINNPSYLNSRSLAEDLEQINLLLEGFTNLENSKANTICDNEKFDKKLKDNFSSRSNNSDESMTDTNSKNLTSIFLNSKVPDERVTNLYSKNHKKKEYKGINSSTTQIQNLDTVYANNKEPVAQSNNSIGKVQTSVNNSTRGESIVTSVVVDNNYDSVTENELFDTSVTVDCKDKGYEVHSDIESCEDSLLNIGKMSENVPRVDELNPIMSNDNVFLDSNTTSTIISSDHEVRIYTMQRAKNLYLGSEITDINEETTTKRTESCLQQNINSLSVGSLRSSSINSVNKNNIADPNKKLFSHNTSQSNESFGNDELNDIDEVAISRNTSLSVEDSSHVACTDSIEDISNSNTERNNMLKTNAVNSAVMESSQKENLNDDKIIELFRKETGLNVDLGLSVKLSRLNTEKAKLNIGGVLYEKMGGDKKSVWKIKPQTPRISLPDLPKKGKNNDNNLEKMHFNNENRVGSSSVMNFVPQFEKQIPNQDLSSAEKVKDSSFAQTKASISNKDCSNYKMDRDIIHTLSSNINDINGVVSDNNNKETEWLDRVLNKIKMKDGKKRTRKRIKEKETVTENKFSLNPDPNYVPDSEKAWKKLYQPLTFSEIPSGEMLKSKLVQNILKKKAVETTSKDEKLSCVELPNPFEEILHGTSKPESKSTDSIPRNTFPVKCRSKDSEICESNEKSTSVTHPKRTTSCLQISNSSEHFPQCSDICDSSLIGKTNNGEYQCSDSDIIESHPSKELRTSTACKLSSPLSRKNEIKKKLLQDISTIIPSSQNKPNPFAKITQTSSSYSDTSVTNKDISVYSVPHFYANVIEENSSVQNRSKVLKTNEKKERSNQTIEDSRKMDLGSPLISSLSTVTQCKESPDKSSEDEHSNSSSHVDQKYLCEPNSDSEDNSKIHSGTDGSSVSEFRLKVDLQDPVDSPSQRSDVYDVMSTLSENQNTENERISIAVPGIVDVQSLSDISESHSLQEPSGQRNLLSTTTGPAEILKGANISNTNCSAVFKKEVSLSEDSDSSDELRNTRKTENGKRSIVSNGEMQSNDSHLLLNTQSKSINNPVNNASVISEDDSPPSKCTGIVVTASIENTIDRSHEDTQFGNKLAIYNRQSSDKDVYDSGDEIWKDGDSFLPSQGSFSGSKHENIQNECSDGDDVSGEASEDNDSCNRDIDARMSIVSSPNSLSKLSIFDMNMHNIDEGNKDKSADGNINNRGYVDDDTRISIVSDQHSNSSDDESQDDELAVSVLNDSYVDDNDARISIVSDQYMNNSDDNGDGELKNGDPNCDDNDTRISIVSDNNVNNLDDNEEDKINLESIGCDKNARISTVHDKYSNSSDDDEDNASVKGDHKSKNKVSEKSTNYFVNVDYRYDDYSDSDEEATVLSQKGNTSSPSNDDGANDDDHIDNQETEKTVHDNNKTESVYVKRLHLHHKEPVNYFNDSSTELCYSGEDTDGDENDIDVGNRQTDFSQDSLGSDDNSVNNTENNKPLSINAKKKNDGVDSYFFNSMDSLCTAKEDDDSCEVISIIAPSEASFLGCDSDEDLGPVSVKDEKPHDNSNEFNAAFSDNDNESSIGESPIRSVNKIPQTEDLDRNDIENENDRMQSSEQMIYRREIIPPGYCFEYLKNGACQKEGKCRFKHSTPTQEEMYKNAVDKLKNYCKKNDVENAYLICWCISKFDARPPKENLLELFELCLKQGNLERALPLVDELSLNGLFNTDLCNRLIRCCTNDKRQHFHQHLVKIFDIIVRQHLRPCGDVMVILLRTFLEHVDIDKFWWLAEYCYSFDEFCIPPSFLQSAIQKTLGTQGNFLLALKCLESKPDAGMKLLPRELLLKMAHFCETKGDVALRSHASFIRGILVDEKMSPDSPVEDCEEHIEDLPLEHSSMQEHDNYCTRIREIRLTKNWKNLADIFSELCRETVVNSLNNMKFVGFYADTMKHASKTEQLFETFYKFVSDVLENPQKGMHSGRLPILDRISLCLIGLDLIKTCTTREHWQTGFKILSVLESHRLDLIQTCSAKDQWKTHFRTSPSLETHHQIDYSERKKQTAFFEFELCVQAKLPDATRKAVEVFREVDSSIPLLLNTRNNAKRTTLRNMLKDLMKSISEFLLIKDGFEFLLTLLTNLKNFNKNVIDLWREGLDLNGWYNDFIVCALKAGSLQYSIKLNYLSQDFQNILNIDIHSQRAVLVACMETGYSEVGENLFWCCFSRKAYPEPIRQLKATTVVLVLTMTPAEIYLIINNVVNKIFQMLCNTRSDQQWHCLNDIEFSIWIKHENFLNPPDMPYLSWAPKTMEQAKELVKYILCQEFDSSLFPRLHQDTLQVDKKAFQNFLVHKGRERGIEFHQPAFMDSLHGNVVF